jgi:hypothetical protein
LQANPDKKTVKKRKVGMAFAELTNAGGAAGGAEV